MSKKEKVGLGAIVNFGETPQFKKSDISTDEIDSAAKKIQQKSKSQKEQKRLTIDMDSDIHKQLKVWSGNTGISIRDASVHLYKLLLSGNIPVEEIKKAHQE